MVNWQYINLNTTAQLSRTLKNRFQRVSLRPCSFSIFYAPLMPRPTPSKMLIYTGPIHAKKNREQQFFDRHKTDIQTRQRGKIPNTLNIARRTPFQTSEKNDVIGEKQKTTDPTFSFQVRSAKRCRNNTNNHRHD